MLSLRAGVHAGVAIPRLEGKCIDNCPTEQGNVAFLVLIVTWFHGAGGLPHQESGLVRNDSIFWVRTRKQQFTPKSGLGRGLEEL